MQAKLLKSPVELHSQRDLKNASMMKLSSGATLILGSQNKNYTVKNCKFYDYFVLEREGEKFVFGLDRFALAENNPEISKMSYYYKILTIIEDCEEKGDDSYVVLCQYYRFSRDKCIEGHKNNDTREVLCTNIIEPVAVSDFIRPVPVYEGLVSVPKGDSDPLSCYQTRFFIEYENIIVDEPVDDRFIGKLNIEAELQKIFENRYLDETSGHRRHRHLENGDSVHKHKDKRKAKKEKHKHKRGRKRSRVHLSDNTPETPISPSLTISPSFTKWIKSMPDIDNMSVEESIYLLTTFHDLKASVYSSLTKALSR